MSIKCCVLNLCNLRPWHIVR